MALRKWYNVLQIFITHYQYSFDIIYTDITREEFILREEDENGNLLSSKYDLLQQEMANLVQVTIDDVIIFTVVNSSSDTIDVIYAIQNPFGMYYRPSKINGLVWLNKDRVIDIID